LSHDPEGLACPDDEAGGVRAPKALELDHQREIRRRQVAAGLDTGTGPLGSGHSLRELAANAQKENRTS